MKYLQVVAVLLGLSNAVKVNGPEMPRPYKGSGSDLVKKDANVGNTKADCDAEDGLYKPYNYKGHCMNPPLLSGLPSCPIDERKVLQDGKTLAVPYPKAHFNCNPYGVAA